MLEASALAIRVFPVPGGPYIRQPYIDVLYTFWWLYSDSLEEFWVGQGKLDSFSEDSELVTESSDIREVNLSRILAHHIEHHRIDFPWQDPHDSQCSLIKCYSGSNNQLRPIDLHLHSHNISSPTRSLDDIYLTDLLHFSELSSLSTSPIICPTDCSDLS